MGEGWEKMLEKLEQPTLTEAIHRYKKWGQSGWNRMTRATIQRHTEEEYQWIVRKKESLWWLDHLVNLGQMDEPREILAFNPIQFNG